MVKACVCSRQRPHSPVRISGYSLPLQRLVLEGPFLPAVYQGRGGRQGRRWGHRLGMNPGQQEAAALTPRRPHPSPSECGGQPGCGLPNEDGEAAPAVRRAAFPSAEVTFPNSTHYRADVGRGWDTY